jgi:hypothetical protein
MCPILEGSQVKITRAPRPARSGQTAEGKANGGFRQEQPFARSLGNGLSWSLAALPLVCHVAHLGLLVGRAALLYRDRDFCKT